MDDDNEQEETCGNPGKGGEVCLIRSLSGDSLSDVALIPCRADFADISERRNLRSGPLVAGSGFAIAVNY